MSDLVSCVHRTMPANLSPEYKAAQAALRQSRDPNERLRCLREMLRVIPKHKGTDHLQADLKRRIHELVEGARATQEGRSARRPHAGGPAGRRRSDRVAGPAERRQVDVARATHGFERSRRSLPVHDTIPGAGNDAVSRRALSAHRPSGRFARASDAMAREHTADGRCMPVGAGSKRSRLCGRDREACTT